MNHGKLSIGAFGPPSDNPQTIPLAAVMGKARSSGHTVSSFARLCGVSVSALHNTLKGTYSLGIRNAERIADATGTTVVRVDGKFMFMLK